MLLRVKLLTNKNVFGKRIAPARVQGYIKTTIPNMTGSQFRMHFRITIEGFEAILGKIGPHLHKDQVGAGRPRVHPKEQLLSVLWILATPDSFR